MKVFKGSRKVRGKDYDSYKMSLSKREAYLLAKLGEEFVIDDVDEKVGSVWLKVKKSDETTTVFEDSSGGVLDDPVSSFRVYLSKRDYGVVKGLVRGRGLSLCRVISDFLRVCLLEPDLVESPSGVKLVNVFLGKPRSRWERKLWEERIRV